ncbi:PREDICTED: uncharacterized protein LOC106750446 [Dinoponera quadriceps]|uniref:Uncharacterized protein LOC106750446 n=1 Tax=Dinoponera quadriceps TaxID=609295 RepID=A0A6P3Y5R1_DINQU|nr:PREDICTED: uncharacterized protein LOC106750446 [Dinoponera quadriceps]
MQKAVTEEKEMSSKEGQNLGITVSGDGSLRKRGFSFLYGLTSLIGWFTRKVIDVEVKSRYCKACDNWKGQEDTAEYDEWYITHKETCKSNHEGSAGKMEVDSVVEKFKRSEELYNVKYVSYIGDGDSKTYKGIVDAQPYGDQIVKKKECVGQVQKRMGSRLRNLKKKTKGFGGAGKLTGKLIDELSLYYGLAIKRNSDNINNMKKEIWATLYHKLSTDEKPQHNRCPSDADSWCTWQSAKATNILASYSHKKPLNEEVFKAIQPIYEELTNDDLLTSCLGAYTQNSNESFNSTVWNLAPKNFSSGKMVLDIATDIVVCTFNDGISSVMNIMKVLNLSIGPNCYNFCLEVDALQVDQAKRSMSEVAKIARANIQSVRKSKDEENIAIESQLYGAGIAD